jgi:nucleoside-diphosphate-sugar epimerase
VTGAAGFIGRHLLDVLKEKFEIIGLDRRSPIRVGAPIHDHISWYQADIGDKVALGRIFEKIKAGGPVDFVIHLAAHYDFTGEEHSEYWNANVLGLRSILEHCRELKPRCFIFSSSVAACTFPNPGSALTEESPPNGDHVYAKSKAAGEAMLAEYSEYFPSVIVRFAALFSDWCEYPPLYIFLRTWLSTAWNARILSGRGFSAVPYLHVKDAISFLLRILRKHAELEDGEVLIGSPDGAIRHRDLFKIATQYYFEKYVPPIHMPRFLVRSGIKVLCFAGRYLLDKPFERPWMADYVDMQLTIDAAHTRWRLGWAPKQRHEILYRLPFMIENFKFNRIEWMRRNLGAMKIERVLPHLMIHSLLQKHKQEIIREITRTLRDKFPSYHEVDDRDHRWNHILFLGSLLNAIHTRMKPDFMSYCRNLAERRAEEGFTVEEVVGALETINTICHEVLMRDEDAREMQGYFYGAITMTIRFGIDQIQEVYDRIQEEEDIAGDKPW